MSPQPSLVHGVSPWHRDLERGSAQRLQTPSVGKATGRLAGRTEQTGPQDTRRPRPRGFCFGSGKQPEGTRQGWFTLEHRKEAFTPTALRVPSLTAGVQAPRAQQGARAPFARGQPGLGEEASENRGAWL